jgi:hypothetical protein
MLQRLIAGRLAVTQGVELASDVAMHTRNCSDPTLLGECWLAKPSRNFLDQVHDFFSWSAKSFFLGRELQCGRPNLGEPG